MSSFRFRPDAGLSTVPPANSKSNLSLMANAG
jgi:hypothetical protein